MNIFRKQVFPLLLVLLVSACGDSSEPPRAIAPTLENVWPNEDGRGWEFQVTERLWPANPDSSVTFADSADVPPPPSLEDIVEWIDHPQYPGEYDEEEYSFSIVFNGVGSTMSGAVGQVLESTFDPPRHIGQIRPLFLSGGIWEKTDEWIGRYGDFDLNLAWKVLTSDTRPGAYFRHEGIASFVLEGWVLQEVTAVTALGTFKRAIRCIYLFSSDPIGRGTVFNPKGGDWRRPFLFGEVIYAPTVGPVYAYERLGVYSGDGKALGSGELEMQLVGLRSE